MKANQVLCGFHLGLIQPQVRSFMFAIQVLIRPKRLDLNLDSFHALLMPIPNTLSIGIVQILSFFPGLWSQ